ncbi:MAG: glycosyl transferase family 4 [Bacteroidetes bacterium B1(2017)]|nr:MAG: glycosyl transferase family 4 [Bacteroidetes bacterium B1(2017)]
MNILQITNRFPWPLKDGGALGYFNFTKGYHQAGVNLTLASLNTEKHYITYDELPDHVKEMADIHLTYIDNTVKPWDAFVNLFSSKSYHVERFICKEFEDQLEQLCKTKHFDVVVFESIFVAPYLDIIRKNSKAVCVLRQHNIEYVIWETLAQIETGTLRKWYLHLLSQRLKKYELSMLNQFDGISAITEVDKQLLLAGGCKKPIEVFPFGIHIDKLIRNSSNVEMPSLFHLGSMDWMPNQEAMKWFIQQVWFDINESFPDLHFYLAGRNIPVSFFDFNNQNNIRVLGEIDDAIGFMNEKAIMIVPLFSGSGIRVKILEGMALGKCIISTDLGAQGIDAIDGEHILKANSAEEFKAKIAFLINNPQEIIRIGENAAKLACEKYDNHKIIARKLNFYERLAQTN